MPRTHSTYPADFRSEAVRLVRSGTPVSTVAKDLDVNQQTLRNWLRQHDIDCGRRSDGLTTEEPEELFRLRRRVKVLEEEKQIVLKSQRRLRPRNRSDTDRAVPVHGRREGQPPRRRDEPVLKVSSSGFLEGRRALDEVETALWQNHTVGRLSLGSSPYRSRTWLA